MAANLIFPIRVPLQSPSSSSSGTATAPGPSISSQPPRDGYTSTVHDNDPDADEDPRYPVPGYPRLTKLIVDYPDFEAFQSFRDLNIKSLLYYQAELAELRLQLHTLEYRDYQEPPIPGAEMCCVTFEKILEGWNSDNDDAKKQYKKIRRIREVLKEYNAALLQYSKICALPEADSFNVNSLRRWLSQVPEIERIQGPGTESWGELGEVAPGLKSLHSQIWQFIRSFFWPVEKEKLKEDLVVPRASSKADGLARWVANECVPLWQCLKEQGKGRSKEQDPGDVERAKTQHKRSKTAETDPKTINQYHEKRILRFTSFTSTVVACLLPTVAIAVLAQLNTTAQLLGVIGTFTAIFAAGLMILVEAGTSRVEIFAATATFSAVMVVFVQNQNGAPYTLGSALLLPNGTLA